MRDSQPRVFAPSMSSRIPLPPFCVLPLVLTGVCLAGCGATSEAVVDEESYMVVGVEPRAAIDESTRALAEHGLDLERRVDAEQFSAASYLDRASGRSAIRVATRRGTALALDARADDGALLALDPRTGEDLTGDANADVVVLRTEAERVCLALAEVDTDGILRPVPTELRWLEPSLCLNELVDFDHDHRVDAVVRVPFRELGEPAPTLAVPLMLDDRPAFAPGLWPEGYAQAEVSRRDAALDVATERGDAATATRTAIELALMIALRGGSDAEIDGALRAADGVPLAGESDEHRRAARSLALALRDRTRSFEETPRADEGTDRGP